MVLLTAGCSEAVSGTARPGTTSSSQPPPGSTSAAAPNAPDLLGDLTTIDPCSLTDPSEFTSFGTATWGELDGLEDCVVKITASARNTITVYVGGLDRTDRYPGITSATSTALPGGITMVELEPEATRCERLLVFADKVTLSVYASTETAAPIVCETVKVGMTKAAKVIQDGAVKHRSFPPGSLGSLDPCDIVPPEAPATVPGLGARTAERSPSKHTCSWSTPDNIRLRVNFVVGVRITARADDKPVMIAGRPTVIYQTKGQGDYVFCSAETTHIPFTAPNQGALAEAANLFVRLPGAQMAAACAAAEQAAAVIWPMLPKP